MNDPEKGHTLLTLARFAIADRFGMACHLFPEDAWLHEPGATFVTLTLHEQLRGCIGSLEAYRALIDDVRHNAIAAAFRDPRFHPLTAQEFAGIRLEVSLLAAAQALRFTGEQDAVAQLRPGLDGVILELGTHRGTFLPQVWEQLPDPRVFMAHLKNKAGLPQDFWSEDIRLSRYTVQKWHEGE
ncbi:MAG: AmmeMemoRadiSam system protein A [Gallionellaceae bacterium]|nr:MAG: AmmeMemoRadiSam system protein A [Gallionellaceae bacterium]